MSHGATAPLSTPSAVYNCGMKFVRITVAALFLLFAGCQTSPPRQITILDGERTLAISTTETTPRSILAKAGIAAQPEDRVFVNGIPYALDDEIPTGGTVQLQLQRAVTVTVVTAGGEQTARTSARTVGEALAQAGIPLMGLDQSIPLENEALPLDGQIKVIRVREVVQAEFQSIPFTTEEIQSEDVAFGQREILQNGVNGAVIVRTRIRYEDGVEVSRAEEERLVLREPVTQIVAEGSKVVLSPVGGEIPYSYWYAAQMYASWYSPCNSGTGGCSYGTASGARAGYGVVAVDYSIYSYLAGMKVYVPGYGLATIGDTGGGPIIESAFGVARTQWIDLGYDDNNIGGLSGWVTVYFLEPAPAEIPYFLK